MSSVSILEEVTEAAAEGNANELHKLVSKGVRLDNVDVRCQGGA